MYKKTKEIIKDSNNIYYQKLDSGTCYHRETPEEVVNILESLLHTDKRIRVWYGENGKSWNEENDICGYIGRSTGTIKIPLLINKRTSFGGGGLLDHCIVKIVDTKSKKVLYQHPNFTQALFSTDKNLVYANGNLYARCKNNLSALRLCNFMNGTRFTK